MTIFDRIIQGELPASFVLQDEHCVAFMDIHPMRPGHVLVVPRQSVPILDELAAPVRDHLWEVARRIGQAQRAVLGSRAQHLLINDGKAASQTVPHVHIHVIPRYGNDHLRAVAQIIFHVATLTLPHRESAKRRVQLDQQAAQISAALKA